MQIKRIIKNITYFCLNCFFFFKPYPAKGVILMYHSVAKNDLLFSVKPENFIQQMEYLRKRNFKIIALKELVEILEQKRPIPKKTVVLTFDDGYQDNYTNAFPILKKYNFPATIFLPTDFIGKSKGESERVVLNMLNWHQIKEMYQSGLIDFQPHSLTHQELSKIDLIKAEQEIRESKEIIEKELNKNCNFFAYPRGSFNQRIIDILKEVGFKAGLGINPGFVDKNTDLSKLSRQSINSQTSMIQFKVRLKFGLGF